MKDDSDVVRPGGRRSRRPAAVNHSMNGWATSKGRKKDSFVSDDEDDGTEPDFGDDEEEDDHVPDETEEDEDEFEDDAMDEDDDEVSQQHVSPNSVVVKLRIRAELDEEGRYRKALRQPSPVADPPTAEEITCAISTQIIPGSGSKDIDATTPPHTLASSSATQPSTTTPASSTGGVTAPTTSGSVVSEDHPTQQQGVTPRPSKETTPEPLAAAKPAQPTPSSVANGITSSREGIPRVSPAPKLPATPPPAPAASAIPPTSLAFRGSPEKVPAAPPLPPPQALGVGHESQR